MYTDKFKGYNELRALGYRHKKKNHRFGFVNGNTHTNGIEGAWSFVKQGLAKHHGVMKKNFPMYLMEQQFRFNNRESDLFTLLIEIYIFSNQLNYSNISFNFSIMQFINSLIACFFIRVMISFSMILAMFHHALPKPFLR